MFFGIEFGKLFRRKFNYIFAVVIVLISAIFIARINRISEYYNMSAVNFVYDFILKIVLALVIFIMGINYIYSYREDYNDKVSVLLSLTKSIAARDFLAVIASIVYFILYYVVIVVLSLALIFIKDRSLLSEVVAGKASSFIAYFVMLILLFVFANLIFLLALSLFNNTNLAVALSLLYFVGGESIFSTLSARLTFLADISTNVLTIFSKAFNELNQNITFNSANFFSIGINIAVLIVLIFVIRVIKKIIV